MRAWQPEWRVRPEASQGTVMKGALGSQSQGQECDCRQNAADQAGTNRLLISFSYNVGLLGAGGLSSSALNELYGKLVGFKSN